MKIQKNKYRTDFIIWSDKYGIYCEENAEKTLMPIMERILSALDSISQEAYKIDFYKAEKSENDLFYLFGVMAFEYASKHYCKMPFPQIKEKYDGNQWCYTGNMETGKHHRIGIGIQRCENLCSRGGYSHIAYNSISGIKFRQMMYDNYINVCEDILSEGATKDINSLANAIQDGYIIKREDGSFFVTVPSFNIKQKEKFDMIADKYLSPLMPEYSEAVDRFIGLSRVIKNFFQNI